MIYIYLIFSSSNGVNGRITVNGHTRDMRVFKKLSTYIMQDDLLQPRLSVQESMRIAANLKLGKELGKAEKELIVSFRIYFGRWIRYIVRASTN